MDRRLVSQKLLEIEYVKRELEGHKDLDVRAAAACLGAAASCLTTALEVAAFRDSITFQKPNTTPFTPTREDAVSVDDLTGHEGFM